MPPDRWGAKKLGYGGDPDEGSAWSLTEITADDPAQAEQRVLAYIDHDLLDDLRGAVAESTGTSGPNRYQVRVNFARPRH